jgi:hypothetical protein
MSTISTILAVKKNAKSDALRTQEIGEKPNMKALIIAAWHVAQCLVDHMKQIICSAMKGVGGYEQGMIGLKDEAIGP